ncbi:MAG: DEAD/DEAH box helicase family protein, partial [Gemmataceae bacterium]|nr:DEAD/DEAH box helicase family protein [Gemmataceae bacterium]
ALREALGRDLDDACRWLADNPDAHPWMRPYQKEANAAVEAAIGQRKREILLAMATGTGKTATAVNLVYRLIKSGVARRVLFLVDRRALAAQAVRSFAGFDAEPNRKFKDIYQVFSQRFRKGELLITVVGAGIGDAAIVPDECNGYNLARAVAKVPIREFDVAYVRRWVETGLAQVWLKGDAREVARPTLNLEQLATLPVPLPPLDEQREIVRQVWALFALADGIEAKLAAARKRVDALTQAVLAKAFRGELVPTEAELARREGREYEPASVLLERVRAERAAPAKGARRKG